MDTLNNLSSNEQLESSNYSGERVRLCKDGKYRWTYPMNMLTNPTVYFTVCKIFGGLGAIAFIATYISDIFSGNFANMIEDLKWWGVAILVFLVISGISYLIVAAQYGGKYIVRFTMDENGIKHEQVPVQKKKAVKLGAVLAGVGALTGSPGRVGQGILTAAHTTLASDFKVVRSIKAQRRWNTIKVNEPFAKNQVYTTKEDFDFVLDYIRSHCPKVK
jgi:hypothetical protein